MQVLHKVQSSEYIIKKGKFIFVRVFNVYVVKSKIVYLGCLLIGA